VCRDSATRMSSDIILRDNKGRLISRGTHRDLKSVRQSLNSSFNETPMTNFRWEIPPAMVVSIPKEIDQRNEVSILIYVFVNCFFILEIQIYCKLVKI